MSDDRFDKARLAELGRHAELSEYTFASAAPGVGRLVARLRAAWNDVATRWHVRPLAAQQSAFNAALVEWLARRQLGPGDNEAGRIALDVSGAQLNRDTAAVAARAARLGGDLNARGSGRRRLRLAYFSPLTPSRSGIADYSAELLPYLAEHADITLFTDGPNAPGNLPRRPVAAFPAERWAYDLPLYQMGNSVHHAAIYAMLRRYPGVTVLHDYVLHHLIAELTLGAGSFAAYAREMDYDLGAAAAPRLRDIRGGRAANPLTEVALNARVIDSSLGLIVHSHTVAEWIHAVRPAARVAVIPHLVAPRRPRSRRAELNLPPQAVLIAVVGQLTVAKQLPLALRAFRRLLGFVPDARFLIVGQALPEVGLDGLLAESGLGESVIRLDYVESFDAFNDWAATADIVLNLRYPTLGETSGAALRVMAAGRALVVFDHGWYAEIPDGAAVKTPPLDEAALLAALLELARSPERRAALGEAAARYVAEVCAPAAVAGAIIDFIAALEPAGA